MQVLWRSADSGPRSPIAPTTVLALSQFFIGTVNAGPEAFDAAIRDLGVFNKRWPDAARSLITNRSPVEDAQDMLLGKTGGIKNVVSFEHANVPSSRR
jgi:hypothetical protein